jgi:predicted nucleic-acid-binding protein
MRAADTNVVVRVLTRDEPTQLRQAEAFIAGGAWVSHLVLAEALWVLGTAYRLDPSDAADTIEMLLNHRDFVLEDPPTVAAALIRFRAHPGLGFSDCLILEIARKAGHHPLGTFDRTLGKLDGAQRI